MRPLCVDQYMQPPVFLGTAGFSHSSWKEQFYPPSLKPPERLAFYASRFKSVEINVSFYRAVAEKTLLAWKAAVPHDFAFTMKAAKTITHYKRLRRCKSDLKDMWRQFAPLESQLACVLVQLPPSLKVDHGLLEDFLIDARDTQAKEKGVEGCRIAVEFRSRRWYEPETFTILDRYDATAVLHDMPYKGGFWPIMMDDEMILKSGHLLMLPEDWIADTENHFFYLRFHGTVKKKPWQEYGVENLEPWARIASRCLLRGKPLFAYFNNDLHAAAVRDAELMSGLLAQEGWSTDAERSVVVEHHEAFVR